MKAAERPEIIWKSGIQYVISIHPMHVHVIVTLFQHVNSRYESAFAFACASASCLCSLVSAEILSSPSWS